MQTNQLAVSVLGSIQGGLTTAQKEKMIVKKSNIPVYRGVLIVSQKSGNDFLAIFTAESLHVNAADNFAQLSTFFHYDFSGQTVKLDKNKSVFISIEFYKDENDTDPVAFHAEKKVKFSKANGMPIAYTSTDITGTLQLLYKQFAGGIMKTLTHAGIYAVNNLVSKANNIAALTTIRPYVPKS